jgi:SAM-dependent methyltransferase
VSEAGRFEGGGPGPQTADGCSVELYRRLPYFGEADCLCCLLPPGSTVLELGCGTGRITRALLDFGWRVTAVDNSAEMLRHAPPSALRVQAGIEQLALDERFDGVLLPTCLINHADVRVRRAFVHAAARHLKPGGLFMLERHDPQWLADVATGRVGMIGTIAVHVDTVVREGGRVSMALRYEDGDACWVHRFSAVPLDDQAIARLLAEAGFGEPGWHGDKRAWACAPLRNAAEESRRAGA